MKDERNILLRTRYHGSVFWHHGCSQISGSVRAYGSTPCTHAHAHHLRGSLAATGPSHGRIKAIYTQNNEAGVGQRRRGDKAPMYVPA